MAREGAVFVSDKRLPDTPVGSLTAVGPRPDVQPAGAGYGTPLEVAASGVGRRVHGPVCRGGATAERPAVAPSS